MKKIKYLIGLITAVLAFTSYSVMAADAVVKEAYFKQNNEVVHTLSNGGLECVINASGINNDAVMINAIYEKNTNKLVSVRYTNSNSGEFKNTLDITNAQNTYVTMCIWDSLNSANAKTQVYSIASSDTAPENPWNVKLNNKGAISFKWEECEDNIKTEGYRIYKNGEKIGDTKTADFNDESVKWYKSGKAEYRLTAYDEYGNESDGKLLTDVSIDNSDIAAVLFSQPNITEKMSLYIATGKETDEGWYGYNTAYIQDGVPCRRIPADGRAVFKYSGDFKNRIGDGVRDAVIRVTYFDNGTDGFKVSYVGKGARYTTFNIVKTNTQQWITKEQKVSDFTAAFIDPREGAKTQDEGVDFTIWSKADSDKGDVVDVETYISEVQVVLEGDAPEPTPTLEPGQTPSPTAEPTPTPTPAPTINPADIKKASINFLAGQTADSCSESENDLIHIFWAGKNNDEQINNSGDKAYNYGVTQNDEECRAIDDDKRLVLIYSNPLNEAIGNEPRNAKIRVRYLDQGTDKIRISYISKTKRYSDLNIQKTDSGDWKWEEFVVTDLVNESDDQGSKGGYQDGRVDSKVSPIYPDGPNLTIWAKGSGDAVGSTEYISQFELILEDETPVETPQPTEQPKPSDISLEQDMDKSTLENIAFKWDAVENAAGYNVYRGEEKLTNDPITNTEYDDSSEELVWYEDYTYKVEAVDIEGTALGTGTEKFTVNKDNFAGIRLLDGTTYDTTYTGEKMTVYWGGTNQHVANTAWFGYSEAAEIGGIKCRKILAAHEKTDGSGGWINGQRISLRFDDTLQNLIGAEPRNAKIRICYYDNGTDGIRVCYISNTDRNKTVNIQKEDTNTWKWYELDVTDLINASPADTSANNGLQDEKTNFAVWGKTKEESNERDTDTYIAEIQLILE